MINEQLKTIDKLFGLEFSGVKLGLENIKKILSELGNPQDNLKFIHIAGTNGKGSVSAIISKVLVAARYNVGLFTSPHLLSIRERFRFNNNGISEEDLTKFTEMVFKATEKLAIDDIKITFFEATVAVALLYFKDKKCDFVVWEVGMGGRFDATNIVNPVLSVITTISLDHQQYLGDTVEKIAFEKAGIIKDNTSLFLGEIYGGALEVIEKKAKEKNAHIHYYDNNKIKFESVEGLLESYFYLKDNPIRYKFGLHGIFQKRNLSLAISVLEYLSKTYEFDLSLALKSLSVFLWHARCQELPDGKILDGAHNIEGINSLINSIKVTFPEKKFNIIFGCLKERNPKEAISLLSEISERFLFVPIQSSRGCFEPNEILEFIYDKNLLEKSTGCKSIDEALELSKFSPTIIVGSLYLAGEVLKKYFSENEILKI